MELARARQAARYAGESWRLNSQAPGPLLRERWPLPDEAQRLVDDHVYAGRLTQRGATRVHRLAWTVADLQGVDPPGHEQVDAAAPPAHRRAPAARHAREEGRMTGDGRDRLARVALGRLAEPGDPRFAGLVAELGAVGLLDSLHRPARPRRRRSPTSPAGSTRWGRSASWSGPRGRASAS